MRGAQARRAHGLATRTTRDVYERGAVWTARLPDIGRKPVVLISDRSVTLALKPVVARVTSVERPRAMPTTVPIEPGDVEGLPHRSYILCHDLTTLKDGDLLEHLGDVPAECLVDIEDRLQFVFGLHGVE
jgi:mRNA-degrading endonuclease toxin of MazEF toxin-antitoxin module